MNIFKFAIDMELDGFEYYKKQAEINKNNMLNPVCLMLAEDERNHAKILENKMNNEDFKLVESTTLSNAKKIFDDIGDLNSPIKEVPTQLDFYREATELERKSIELYTDLATKAVELKDKELFDYLIQQEEKHFKVLDQLANMLRKTEDWVEDAEFGLREKY